MPVSVELSFLEQVKQLELYGAELYPLLVSILKQEAISRLHLAFKQKQKGLNY